VFPRDDRAYTSVVVPSLTLDPSELTQLRGATFYEERLLFLLIRLRNPHARLVYVTSQPVHPMVLRSLVPEDLVEILTVDRLGFSHGTQTGVLFHMMGAVSEFGKVGMVAIGNGRTEAEAIFAKTVETLDDETRYG
jgi:hypothetical protein